MSNDLQNKIIFRQVAALLQNARQEVLRTVNSTMTITYFEIGRIIVEEEQNGKDLAEYVKQLLKGLSEEFGKGFSVRNLEKIRKFYITYSISKTVSAVLQIQKTQSVTGKFKSQKVQSLTAESNRLDYQTLSSFF